MARQVRTGLQPFRLLISPDLLLDALRRTVLAEAVMRAKKLDVDQRVFRNNLTQSIVTLFGRLERKRVVRCLEERRGVKLWAVA